MSSFCRIPPAPLPAAFRKLDAVAVLTARSLLAPRVARTTFIAAAAAATALLAACAAGKTIADESSARAAITEEAAAATD